MPVSKYRYRVCQECGVSYELGVDSTQHKYCSLSCRNRFHNKIGLLGDRSETVYKAYEYLKQFS